MRPALGLLLFIGGLLSTPALALSELLDSIKRDPAEAKAMCRQFRTSKATNKSFDPYSRKTTLEVARKRQLSANDAEILITYVVGMHCPDVH